MKALILAAIRCSLMFTAVAALSVVYPASVQAVPTTYHYTGNPFTEVHGVYTTNDFVTAMVTLADPLPPNFHGDVTPTAFTLSDGVQTLTNTTPLIGSRFIFVTNAPGEITLWEVTTRVNDATDAFIDTIHEANQPITEDRAAPNFHSLGVASGFNFNSPGVWTQANAMPDAGSTLSLMTLTLMALGVATRRLKQAAA